MRLFEIDEKFIPNPFPNSKLPMVLYHGTFAKFSKFNNPKQGIYVTPYRSWAEDVYANPKYAKEGDTPRVIPLYANVRALYDPTFKEADYFYDRDYESVSRLLAKLSAQGYNACLFGGESDSTVLFGDIDIVHAVTGEKLI